MVRPHVQHGDRGQRMGTLRTLSEMFPIPDEFLQGHLFLVGAKGTGMTALAELLVAGGAVVSGSDVAEEFYTDRILAELGVPLITGFAATDLPPDTTLVIHSAAYDPATNPQLLEAKDRGLPLLSYPEALGRLSGSMPSAAIAGVHGKTTTTALYGALAKASGAEASVLAGSAVSSFGGRSTLLGGNRSFVAETCEYRRHFLHFRPQAAVVTSVEADHLDYFRDRADVMDAFLDFAGGITGAGPLIYCADDAGAKELAERAGSAAQSLRLVPYGRTAAGTFRIANVREEAGAVVFSLPDAGLEHLVLRVPGLHNVFNAAAALALLSEFNPGGSAPGPIGEWNDEVKDAVRDALAGFRGTTRRAEVVGVVEGIRIMDDYGHHPTAIRSTLAGIRSFYRPARLIVSFMSHTYSRTRELIADFSTSFGGADRVYIHRIYASARETPDPTTTGEGLARAISAHHPDVRYIADPDDAVGELAGTLRPGDLMLTLGAGNNWTLGRKLLSVLETSAVTGGVAR